MQWLIKHRIIFINPNQINQSLSEMHDTYTPILRTNILICKFTKFNRTRDCNIMTLYHQKYCFTIMQLNANYWRQLNGNENNSDLIYNGNRSIRSDFDLCFYFNE